MELVLGDIEKQNGACLQRVQQDLLSGPHEEGCPAAGFRCHQETEEGRIRQEALGTFLCIYLWLSFFVTVVILKIDILSRLEISRSFCR